MRQPRPVLLGILAGLGLASVLMLVLAILVYPRVFVLRFPAPLSPADRAWCTYLVTEHAIVASGNLDYTSRTCIQNAAAFQELVARNELIRISYASADTQTQARLANLLAQTGIRDYRCSTSIIGGQWPVDTLYVTRADEGLVRRALRP